LRGVEDMTIRESIYNWAVDAFTGEVDEDTIRESLEALDDKRLTRWVNYHYDGGLNQFIKDGGE